uniref:Uncharacterized protein n=1 Tax=Strongyloides venezuelensis TaxID=75913 RepID=A0A0K0G5B2_STRVS
MNFEEWASYKNGKSYLFITPEKHGFMEVDMPAIIFFCSSFLNSPASGRVCYKPGECFLSSLQPLSALCEFRNNIVTFGRKIYILKYD